MNLVEGFQKFDSGRKVEIAHIDAAKDLSLWKLIVRRLGPAVIPNRTIWIFQDFERVRLPWQIYGLNALMPFGEIIGGSNYATLYFKFREPIDALTLDKIVNDDFTLLEKCDAVEAMFRAATRGREEVFRANWPVDDLRLGAIAYCNLQHGERERARKVFLETTEIFRANNANKVYADEIL